MSTIGFKYHSGPVRTIEAVECNTSTFTVGDLVTMAAGLVTIATDDQAVYGVALKAGSGAATGVRTIPVRVITPDTLFVAQVDTTSALTQVGIAYGLNIATAGSMEVDVSDTTTTSVRIERLDSRDGAKAKGRVIVRFDPTVLTELSG